MTIKSSSDKVSISETALVKVTQMNHIIEIQHMEKVNRKANIKKLDSDTYLDIATGEIKEFSHSTTRKDNLNSLRQTFKRLRYIINNNFTGQGNELHVILTYKREMKDNKELYKDFDKFIKRLRYTFKKDTSIDYLTVVEPHASGEWHCHVLMRFNELDKVYIKNKDLRALWGHGFVTIKSLKDVDNIGAYLSAYLADVELEEGGDYHEAQIKIVDGKEKKFIKGGRLHMYPPGMNLFRKSKGILEPERVEMPFREAKKIVGSAQPHYQKSITICDGEFENTISYVQYNTKRIK
jgi:hypothetical protein